MERDAVSTTPLDEHWLDDQLEIDEQKRFVAILEIASPKKGQIARSIPKKAVKAFPDVRLLSQELTGAAPDPILYAGTDRICVRGPDELLKPEAAALPTLLAFLVPMLQQLIDAMEKCTTRSTPEAEAALEEAQENFREENRNSLRAAVLEVARSKSKRLDFTAIGAEPNVLRVPARARIEKPPSSPSPSPAGVYIVRRVLRSTELTNETGASYLLPSANVEAGVVAGQVALLEDVKDAVEARWHTAADASLVTPEELGDINPNGNPGEKTS
jgi:hypothetical protein